MDGVRLKLKEVLGGEGKAHAAPPRNSWRRKRRCTNEAVRAMRPSQLDSRFRLAEAQCFPQHSGRTLGEDLGWGTPLNQPRPHAEPIPALVRFRLPALHGQALHGRMVRDECELMYLPVPSLVRGRTECAQAYRHA